MTWNYDRCLCPTFGPVAVVSVWSPTSVWAVRFACDNVRFACDNVRFACDKYAICNCDRCLCWPPSDLYVLPVINTWVVTMIGVFGPVTVMSAQYVWPASIPVADPRQGIQTQETLWGELIWQFGQRHSTGNQPRASIAWFHFTGHCLTHPIVAAAATELQAEKAANETFFLKHYKPLTTVLPKYVDDKSIIQKLN